MREKGPEWKSLLALQRRSAKVCLSAVDEEKNRRKIIGVNRPLYQFFFRTASQTPSCASGLPEGLEYPSNSPVLSCFTKSSWFSG